MMKGVAPLFLGIFGTFAFSWAGLTMIPNVQIGHLDPQTDEEGTDVYPAPKSGLAMLPLASHFGVSLASYHMLCSYTIPAPHLAVKHF